MESAAGFLLGGAIGAALGFLLSRKTVRRAPIESARSVPGSEGSGLSPEQGAGGAAEAGAPGVVATATAVVDVWPEPAPQTWVEPPAPAGAEVEEAASTEAAATETAVETPAPTAEEVETPVPTAEEVEVWPVTDEGSEVPTLTVLDAPAQESPEQESPEPVVFDPAVPAGAVELDYPAGLPAEPDVVLTPELLEEPLPGSGWGASVVMAVDEATVDDLLPVAPDVVAPLAADEARIPSLEAAGEEPAQVWPDEAVEVSSPESPHRGEPPSTESATSEPAVEEVAFDSSHVEEPVLELPVVEESVSEAALVEEVASDTPVVDGTTYEDTYEVIATEEPTFELPVIEEPVYQIPSVTAPASGAATPAETPVVVPPAVDSSRIDDLKARIEETRRRIRRELEHPFVTMEEAQTLETDWTISPAIPATEPVEAAESASAESDEPATDTNADSPSGATWTMEEQEPMDYELMKSRIEATRSRLKAKAFDAMMAGESALLGRDDADAERADEPLPTVDKEIEESIESSLREEEG